MRETGCSNAMSLGARLKEERRRLGLKQAEFAALVGTDMPRQSLYERASGTCALPISPGSTRPAWTCFTC